MSETLDYLIAQAFEIPAGTTMSVDDDLGSGRTVTMTPGFYRTFAAQGNTGAGTEVNPYELIFRLRQELDPSNWNVSIRPNGKVRITYLGLAPNGAITWGSGPLSNLLGFLTDIGPVATGQHTDADYLPTHCIFFAACEDSGWGRSPGRFSGARMPNGKVYGWGDRLQGRTCTLTLRLLPKDNATRDAIIAADANAVPPTPCFGPTSRATSPATGEPGQVFPWGAVETIATAGGKSLGVMLGTLQTAIANPGGAAFEHCFFTPETVSAGGEVQLSVAGYDPRRDIGNIELSFYAAETR